MRHRRLAPASHFRCDGIDERLGAENLRIFERRDAGKVACHLAGFDRIDGCRLQAVGERHEAGQFVQLAALAQRACPREDGGHRVRRRLLAVQVLVVMPRDSCAFVKIKTPEKNIFKPGMEEITSDEPADETAIDEPVIESTDIFETNTEFSAAD